VPETGGPVPTFTTALQARDLATAAGLLAHDVRLAVPPLHYGLAGVHDVAAGIASLFTTFGELRYDLRGRYLGPACVTDEVVLVGRQSGPFLGVPPARHPVSVPARVIIDHDEASITRITLWPDLGALRASVAGAEQVIDLRIATGTGGMIAALRATIPPRRTRIVVAGPRIPPPDPEPAPGPSPDPTASWRPVPRAPVPKNVRRRRAVLGGGAMLVAAVALAGWVAVGALRLPGTPVVTEAERGIASAAPDTEATAGAGADRAGGSAEDDQARLAPAQQLAEGNDTVIIRSDLLFATDSATLNPKARVILTDLIAQARRQDRHGRVIVNGYTDDVGPLTYNLRLSKRRAAAVATVLARGLKSTGMKVESHGYGEARPARPGTDAVTRRGNRRVTVEFPPQG